MTQPWFDANRYASIPAAVFGAAAGTMGALIGWLTPPGKARSFVLRAWPVFGRCGLLPGVIGTVVLGGNLVIILKRYRELEERRLAAKDLV